MPLGNDPCDKLKRISTATISTALFERGLRGQTIQDVRPLRPLGESMVGEAYTLRYMPAREDLNQRPSAPADLTRHQAIDINVPIGCGDAPVFPGDVVVGDNDGVIIIPAHLAEEIAAETTEMTAYEDFVTERVRAGQSIRGLYPMTDEANRAVFQAWRAANGR